MAMAFSYIEPILLVMSAKFHHGPFRSPYEQTNVDIHNVEFASVHFTSAHESLALFYGEDTYFSDSIETLELTFMKHAIRRI